MSRSIGSCVGFWLAALLIGKCLPGGCLLAEDLRPVRYYLIGNSLTWDTVPSKLDGDVQWHVDCGKSLPYMFAHPEKPCVKSSTLWPTALKQKQYDYLVVQPHYGSTLSEDVETIVRWAEMQPHAKIVIHTGWARQESRADEYSSSQMTGNMVHSPAYFSALISQLRERLPGREFAQTHAIDLLEQIHQDIARGLAPFRSLSELHRDKIHMKLDTGRYLMHNTMRRALGQPPSSKGFEKLNPETKKYLDSVLDRVWKAADSAAQASEPELRAELLRRMKKDQAMRAEMLRKFREDGINFDGKTPLSDPAKLAVVASVTAKLRKVDEDNRRWLKEIVQKSGWPGKSRVGEDGAHAAWLLVQHADADPEFQQFCLEQMQALPKGEVSSQDLAYLIDRVLVAQKKPQRYGTQLDAAFQPLPIEEGDVDERRREMGLPPMSEYLKMAREAYERMSREKSTGNK